MSTVSVAIADSIEEEDRMEKGYNELSFMPPRRSFNSVKGIQDWWENLRHEHEESCWLRARNVFLGWIRDLYNEYITKPRLDLEFRLEENEKKLRANNEWLAHIKWQAHLRRIDIVNEERRVARQRVRIRQQIEDEEEEKNFLRSHAPSLNYLELETETKCQKECCQE